MHPTPSTNQPKNSILYLLLQIYDNTLLMLGPGNVRAYLTSLYRRYKESSNKDQSTFSGCRDNIRRKLKVSPEEVNAIICKMPVAVLPRENLANILFIFEALHQFDHL